MARRASCIVLISFVWSQLMLYCIAVRWKPSDALRHVRWSSMSNIQRPLPSSAPWQWTHTHSSEITGHWPHIDTVDRTRELLCMQLLWKPQVMFITLTFRWILNGWWTSTVSGCRWLMATCEAKWICSRVTSMTCILDQSVSIWCATCDLVCHIRSECVVEWKATQNGVRGRYHESPQQIIIHLVSFGHPESLTGLSLCTLKFI
jgi:hypothetical protein